MIPGVGLGWKNQAVGVGAAEKDPQRNLWVQSEWGEGKPRRLDQEMVVNLGSQRSG